MKINSKRIRSFVVGHYNWFLDKLGSYPKYKQEQILYRLSLCKDCIKAGECEYCGCPPEKKVYDNASCNNGVKFPRIMNESSWNKYKISNNVNINDNI